MRSINDYVLLHTAKTHVACSYVDLVVECVEAAQLLQERADVAQLIGAVFALYCSYSLQLGSPKLKIPVDPHAWASLASIETIVASVHVQQWFPQAAAQVMAMLRRLEDDEKAFLKCLRGSNAQHRQSFVAVASARAVLRPDRLQQVTQDQADRLALLKEQYSQRMSAIASQDSSAGLRKKKDSLMGQVSAETEAREAAMGRWTQALDSFMEPPPTPMPPLPMPMESSTGLLEDHDHDQAVSYSGDEDNNFALLEAELQASLSQQTAGSTRSRGFSIASSDDALAELDAELSREVESVAISRAVAKRTPVRRQTLAAPRRRVAATISSSVPSSDAGSDDLAALQAELDAAPNQKPSVAAAKPRAARKRPVPRSLSVASSDDLAALQAELDSTPGGHQPKRVQPKRTTTRKQQVSAAQVAMSAPLSIAESDDLAALQAELDATPHNEDEKTRSSAKKKAQAPQRRAPRKPRTTATTQRQRAPSSVSDVGSVDYLAALQAELDSTPLPIGSTATAISSKAVNKQPARRATRKRSTPASTTSVFSAAPLSVASSDSAMNNLQAELESSLNLLKAPEPQAKKSAKRARRTTPTPKRAPAKPRAPVKPRPVQRKPPVKSRAVAQPRMMTRARSASSVAASESDRLAELEAELQAAP